MKRVYILFTLTLLGAVILFGCTPSSCDGGNGGSINEDGDVIDNSNSGEQETENGTTGEENTDNNSGGSTDELPNENQNDLPDDTKNELPDDTQSPVVGTGVGDLFRSITLERLDGESVSPDDYRGKIIILNIWATWCPPCKAELPDFNIIASEYKDDVVIIAAHTPSGNENALSYVETNFPETDIIFAYDTIYSEAFLAAGGEKYVPRTAIIDENGVIIYGHDGLMTYEQIVSIIESHIGG